MCIRDRFMVIVASLIFPVAVIAGLATTLASCAVALKETVATNNNAAIDFIVISVSYTHLDVYKRQVLRLFSKANQFFIYLAEEKFDDAYQTFDETEKSKLTADNLKTLWGSITKNLGQPVTLDAIQSKAEGEFFVVTVEGVFEDGKQNFTIVFNKAENIVGFYMPPNKTEYSKPFYVDTDSFVEETVYLKSGTHQLAAIITTPKGVTNFPMVVLVHGSGPSDMDGSVGPNKPLKDIANGLAGKGIGSVRYVKRLSLIHI